MVMVSVPTAVVESAVTTPVLGLMLIPAVGGVMLNSLVPVPSNPVNAAEDFAKPKVVVMFDPPPMATMESTITAKLIDVDTLSESVAVTLS